MSKVWTPFGWMEMENVNQTGSGTTRPGTFNENDPNVKAGDQAFYDEWKNGQLGWGQTAPDAPYKNSTGAITSLRGGRAMPDAPYKGSTGPITSLRVKDPNGYFDSNTGVFVNRDVRDAQRNKPIAPALGMGGGAPNKSVDPRFVQDALMRNAANQAKMAGAGVRPGAMPPMNAVQAARGQQPTPAPQGMAGSFIPPGAYNPNRPYVGPTPGIA